MKYSILFMDKMFEILDFQYSQSNFISYRKKITTIYFKENIFYIQYFVNEIYRNLIRYYVYESIDVKLGVLMRYPIMIYDYV